VRNNDDSDVILRLCREVKLNLLRLGSSHLGLRHTKAILDIHAAVDRRIKGRLMAIHQQRRNARRAIEATLAIVWLVSALAAQAMDTSDDSAIVIDMSNKLSDQEAPPPAAEPEVVRAYQFQIETLELQQGAYAAALTEPLMGLGTTLQTLDRHQEAIEVFKRGVHLARINEGLYGREQIALIRAEINSHMALADWTAVDERQRYLYRVEREALVTGAESAAALLKQADWQRQAFMLGVGEEDSLFGRLQIMWDLYRMSFNEYKEAFGNQSIELRKPLLGMLQTQYLFAGYRTYEQFGVTDTNELRILGLNSQTYRQGESILKGILELNVANQVSVTQHVRDVVALGDWAWWFGKDDQALMYYQEAMELMTKSMDPEGILDEVFGLPMLLPHVQGIAALPAPIWNDSGDLAVNFSVTESGKVDNLERLGDPEVELDRAAAKLFRALKQAQFRPRFEDGLPVSTENITWSWQASVWQERTVVLSRP